MAVTAVDGVEVVGPGRQLVVVVEATPLALSVPVPTTVPLGLPRWKVTVPVGEPVPEDLVTVAVSVTP